MPLAKKSEGYPVDAATAATATVEKPSDAPRSIPVHAIQPSAKDVNIVRQVSWKIAGPLASNFAGKEDVIELATQWAEKIEAHILRPV